MGISGNLYGKNVSKKHICICTEDGKLWVLEVQNQKVLLSI